MQIAQDIFELYQLRQVVDTEHRAYNAAVDRRLYQVRPEVAKAVAVEVSSSERVPLPAATHAPSAVKPSRALFHPVIKGISTPDSQSSGRAPAPAVLSADPPRASPFALLIMHVHEPAVLDATKNTDGDKLGGPAQHPLEGETDTVAGVTLCKSSCVEELVKHFEGVASVHAHSSYIASSPTRKLSIAPSSALHSPLVSSIALPASLV
jgi:hypothetical protein